jgi:hypothetical protein
MAPIRWSRRISLSKENVFVQYFFEQPIDEGHTRIFFINMRNCLLEESNDARMRQINLAIADEDIAVITALNPVRTPESSTKEVLVVGDEAIGRYRQRLTEWERRGWRIDLAALRANAGDVAYAVPCPGAPHEPQLGARPGTTGTGGRRSRGPAFDP